MKYISTISDEEFNHYQLGTNYIVEILNNSINIY